MIKEYFEQAVIGSAVEDAELALRQIHRPEINLVTTFMPLAVKSVLYLQNLDFVGRYLPGDEFATEAIACFHFRDNALTPDFETYCKVNPAKVLPQEGGRDDFLQDIEIRARLFRQITDYPAVSAQLIAYNQSPPELYWHPDGDTDLRGLQTLFGEHATLWMPDERLNPANTNLTRHYCNQFSPFDVRNYAQSVDVHHMSIHKGDRYPNPLYHAPTATTSLLNLTVGSRLILRLNKG